MQAIFLAINFATPFEDPVLKFLVLLAIILLAPLLLNKVKVPAIIGLIIAGALIGPNGLNILPRDQNVVVTGTTGLLYIMFLAGLEIDLADFKRNSSKSGVFGLLTFLIPMTLGTLSGYYILGFGWMSSILFASLMASHTLLSYPIISKLGVAKNLAVNVSVGGTMITDVLALLVLAVIVGMTQGEVNSMFWIKMGVSLFIFGVVVLYGFPIIGRLFFKKVNDKTSQYLFVLTMVFLGALLAELAGVEAIIGAFFAGLALNRLIPHSSSLMNRIDFVGNAYFIPFFLISVGMLIDYRAFIQDTETIIVAIVMTVVVVVAKYLASVFTAKIYGFSGTQRQIIFGLSVAQAAATLAAVLVGYNIVIGETELGQPIRLLSGSVLNGSILMILITCTISSIVSQRNAEKLAKDDANDSSTADEGGSDNQNILCLINANDDSEHIIELSIHLKENDEQIIAMSVTNDHTTSEELKSINKTFEQIEATGHMSDINIETMRRHDIDYIAAIKNVSKEQSVKDIVLSAAKQDNSNFYNNVHQVIREQKSNNVIVQHLLQPLGTISKMLIVCPGYVQHEAIYDTALERCAMLVKNINTNAIFYGDNGIKEALETLSQKVSIEYEYKYMAALEDFLIVTKDLDANSCVVVIMPSEAHLNNGKYANIPRLLSQYAPKASFLLFYPSFVQDNATVSSYGQADTRKRDAQEFLDIGNTITDLFKNKSNN